MEEPANNNKPNNKKNIFKPLFNVMWIYVILLGGIAFMWFTYDGGEPVKTEWIEVKEKMITNGDVEKIVFVTNLNRAEVYIKKDSIVKYKNKFGGKTPKVSPQF